MRNSSPRASRKLILLIALFFSAGVFFQVGRAASITDSGWASGKGTLNMAINDNGILRIEYNFGTGKDGPFSGTSINMSFWDVSSVGLNYVALSSSPSLASGDMVLLIKMQGTNAGTYEFLEVGSVSGQTVFFKTNVKKSYTTGELYIQRVPQFTNADITSEISGTAWKSGGLGIISFMASGTLTITSTINASGLGYRGGGVDDEEDEFQFQGESISGTGSQSRNANVGGGGGGRSNHDSDYGGGGGGGYGIAGSNGSGGDLNDRGVGGGTYYNSAKINLGSGGGGGGGAGDNLDGGKGARGGGAVIVYARNTAGSGSIEAKGYGGIKGDCGGGGGSGGLIMLTTLSSPSISTSVSGGSGGSHSHGDCGNGGSGGAGKYYLNNNPNRFPEGNYTSAVFSSGSAYSSIWDNITISLASALSASQSINIYYHACASSDCSDKADAWTLCGTFTSGSSLECSTSADKVGNYFQYKLQLSTTDLPSTPSVSSVKISYTAEAPPAVAITGMPTNWVNTDQTATILCIDAETSCDINSYRFKTYSSSPPENCPADYNQYQPTDPVSSQMKITSEAWVCGAAKDSNGNPNYSPKPEYFSIDKAPPVAEVINESAAWVRSNNLTLKCSDSLSGCQQAVYYAFVSDPGSSCQSGGTTITSGFFIAGAGGDNINHNDYFCIRVYDRAGNIDTDMSSQLWVDVANPSTTDDVNPDIWYGNPAQIKLTCSDALSGCNKTYYCIADQTGTCTPSTISTSQETILQVNCGQGTCSKKVIYYSEDRAGNREAAKTSGTIKIDTTLPVCALTSPASPYTTSTQIAVSWQASAQQGASPVRNVTIEKNESGIWETLTVSQSTSGTYAFTGQNGRTYSFRCMATNEMGKTGAPSPAATITVDTGSPAASITAPSPVNTTTFLVSWSGEDLETGVANYTVYYKIGTGSYTKWDLQPSATSAIFGQYGQPTTPENNKIYTFKVKVMDMAGNSKESSEASVLADTAKPACAIESMPAYQPSSDFTVRWSGIDEESGIKEYTVEQRTGTTSWAQFYRGAGTSKDTYSSPDGTYRFRCMAADKAGNAGDFSAEKNTTVDMNSPEIQTDFSDSIYVNESLLIKATVTDTVKISSATLYYNNEIMNETSISRNTDQTAWEITWIIYNVLEAGLNSFTITTRDANGNTNNQSYQFTVRLCDEGVTQKCGACGSGTKTCRNGIFTQCAGEDRTLVKPEVCNGQDDDCNGIVDDVGGGNSITATRCQCYGYGLSAAKSSEDCNGIDDNCNGEADENGGCCEPGKTQICGVDTGICSNKLKACTEDGAWGPCLWEHGPNPAGEICGNSLDDDCDDKTDEDCLQCLDMDGDGSGSPASNMCAYPDQDCDDSDLSVYPGAQETCDGKDNNCDGNVDEGLECDHCSNKAMDADEEGTDCGGNDCPACFVWGWLFITAGGIVILLILLFLWLHFRGQGRELTWEELNKKWTPE